MDTPNGGAASPLAQPWHLAGRDLTSRLIVGTGGAPSLDVLGKVLAASGTQLTTVAMRRVSATGEGSLIGTVRQAGVALIPNTAGCHTAAEALLTARLAREALETDLVKLEGLAGQPRGQQGFGGGVAARGVRDEGDAGLPGSADQ